MLKIEDLSVQDKNASFLLKQVSIDIPDGSIIGLTGHSGSGKTTLIRSVFGMLHEDCHISSGKICTDDVALTDISGKSHRKLCGNYIGYIPQMPMTAFDSRVKIGTQMKETFKQKLHLSSVDAVKLAEEKLWSVNLKDTKRVLNAYPGELSGGMLQRVAAAFVLGMSPQYIFADEPTAALDEENRDLLLAVMRKQMKGKGILFASHDVQALKVLCEKVYVIGKGEIIEQGSMKMLLKEPKSEWMKQFAKVSGSETSDEWKWESL